MAETTPEASPAATGAEEATARTRAQMEFFGLDETHAAPPVTPGGPAATGAAVDDAPAAEDGGKLRKRVRLKK